MNEQSETPLPIASSTISSTRLPTSVMLTNIMNGSRSIPKNKKSRIGGQVETKALLSVFHQQDLTNTLPHPQRDMKAKVSYLRRVAQVNLGLRWAKELQQEISSSGRSMV